VVDAIYELPIETLATLVAIAFVGSYWAGCIVIRPFLRIFVRAKGGENAIVGNVLSAFGVLYGLLLSLIAVAAYQNLSEVDYEVTAEAAALLSLHRDASDMPSPRREQLQSLLRDYCRSIIDEEWPMQRKGLRPTLAYRWLDPIRDRISGFEPKTKGDELLQARAFEHLEAMSGHGGSRRYSAGAGIPAVMWYVVIVGTIINFALMWLFDTRFITQLFLGGLLAFFLGALILLIAVLERPYRSAEYGISPQAYEVVHGMMLQEEGDASVKKVQEDE